MGVLSKTNLLYTGVALLSLAAGIFTAQWLDVGNKPATTQAPNPVGVPEQRVDFSLLDLNGQQRRLSEWDGDIILLNFWATWCPPCRKEMPDFVELMETYNDRGLTVIGVALDRAEPVQNFIDEIGVEYPILLAELEGMEIMRSYGNQLLTLPYTVVIDQNGEVVKAFRTEVTKAQVLTALNPLLTTSNAQ